MQIMKGFLRNLVGKDSGSGYELPGFEIDTKYERIQLRPSISDENSRNPFDLIHKDTNEELEKLDEEHVKQLRCKGFEKLCRDSFLDLLKRIKLQKTPDMKTKILFLDSETSILFRRLITWLEIKYSDIACLFILNEDRVSNYLTQHAIVFYLISMDFLKVFEKEFFNGLKNRKCLKQYVFIRGQRNSLNKEHLKLVEKLMITTRNEVNFLDIFLPINESVILIDNSIKALRFLIKQLHSNSSINESAMPSEFRYQKYSNNLAYLLFRNNLNPSIRYLNNFNVCNKMIAEQTTRILSKFYETNEGDSKNDQNLEKANSDCILLIVDRSIDFLTPLLHSNNYYQFVNQELEEVMVTDFSTLDDKLEDASLKDVAEKLIMISKQMTANQLKTPENKRTLSQFALYDRKAGLLAKHIGYVNQIRNRLKNGYQHFVTIEQQLMNKSVKSDSNQTKSSSQQSTPKSSRTPELKQTPKSSTTKKMKPKSDQTLLSELIDLEQKEFINFLNKILASEKRPQDWMRLLCIYSVMKGPLESATSKLIASVLDKQNLKKLDKFIDLVKRIGERNGFKGPVKFVSLKSLIEKALHNKLDAQRYPTLNSSVVSNPKKLLIFMSGGISFNELYLAKQTDVVLISDSILYSKLFLNSLID